MRQEIRCKLQPVGLLLICILLSAWSLVYKCFADADGIVTGILAFMVFAWASLALYKRKTLPSLERVDLLFVLWMAYRWVRMTGPLNFGTLSEDALCIGAWVYFRTIPVHDSRRMLESVVCLSAVIQVVVIMLQWCGCLSSHHAEFRITGTFGNPGPLGAYLAMAVALVMPEMMDKDRKVKACALLLLAILGLGLFLSDSRAAWLSVAVAVYCLMALAGLKGKARLISFVALPLAALGLASVLYFHRPASADARMQIWKNTVEASAAFPVFGHGYGSFQATYMDYQASRLSRLSETEQWKADDVLAPYNEPLGYLYELGLVGVMLFLVCVTCALKQLHAMYRKENANGLFVLVAYLTFSLFSYPSCISCLHVLFVACIASSFGQWNIDKCQRSTPLVHVCSAGVVTLALSSLVLVSMRIHIQRTFSHMMYAEGREASTMENGIPMWLVEHDTRLLSQYIHVLLFGGDCETAIPMLERQACYVNTSRLQMDLATAYEDAGNSDLALLHYRKAHAMRPGLIEPLYAQFCIYKDSNRNKALSLARECIRIQPKVKNRRTEAMKAEARKFVGRNARFPARDK